MKALCFTASHRSNVIPTKLGHAQKNKKASNPRAYFKRNGITGTKFNPDNVCIVDHVHTTPKPEGTKINYS